MMLKNLFWNWLFTRKIPDPLFVVWCVGFVKLPMMNLFEMMFPTYFLRQCCRLGSSSGNLVARDLTNLVPAQSLKETEYLTTLLVVVPSTNFQQWKDSYETLTEFVLPRSTDLIYQDKDAGLWSVTLFKKVVEDFKLAAREQKWIVRKYERTEGLDPAEMKKLKEDKARLKKALVRWCDTNFAETYVAWIHLKCIRCFVESVLRFGPMANFEAVLLWPNPKQIDAVHKSLISVFGHLDGNRDDKEESEGVVPVSLASAQAEKFYPYVSLDVVLDLRYETRD
jgi:V-type H+-transporting ATPase subunit C